MKRECVRLNFIGYRGLCKVLDEYVAHYNAERPHQGNGNRPPGVVEPPGQKPIAAGKPGKIRCLTRCRGAIRHYERIVA